MTSINDFYGNPNVARSLVQMIESGRIAQTILLSGPEGVGKATLARRFAAALLGDSTKIEQDDLSLPANQEVIEQRDKWTAEKRNEDPLLFSSHPDFVTFAPDGPLRQLSIPQMRLLRARAQFKPLRGAHRVFLIDHLERANEQSANSLLKLLEEPPDHLVIIATTENVYDVLPTIRSRSLVFQMNRLTDDEMQQFISARDLRDAEPRIALSEGSPGIAAMLDVEQLRERRAIILAALECGAGVTPFATWIQQSESFGAHKSEKLEFYIRIAYGLVEDVLRGLEGKSAIRNRDVQTRIQAISNAVNFRWIDRAVMFLDELVEMMRRNIQKVPALDAFVVHLRYIKVHN